MILITIHCDECGEEVIRELTRWTTKSRMVEWLREKGWSFGKHTRCPGCVQNPDPARSAHADTIVSRFRNGE